MNSNHEIDFGTLSWVKKEIDETLNQARQALEAAVENPDDTSQLGACAAHLHQVHGTLRMVELYGAALLAEEMELIATALVAGTVAARDEANEVLMRAILQLPDYLERLLVGHKDIPLVLMPLLNDLRAARGQTLLSDNVLFSPDIGLPLPVQPQTSGAVDVGTLARSLRHQYQTGLLAWLRNSNGKAGLRNIAEVLTRMERAATIPAALRLWWIAGGVVEALHDDGLTASFTVNQLLGQIDRQIKQVIDAGEQSLDGRCPPELIKNLLYYVAHAEPRGERVPAIQQAFKLVELLPREEEIAAARDSMSGRNAALMATVGAAIKEDLTRIKESLDVFVRNEQRQAADLLPLGAALSKLADTLAMLGMGKPRQRLKEQAEVIDAIAAGNCPADEERLMKMASVLVYVDSCLEGLGVGRSVQRHNGGFGAAAEDGADSDYREAMGAVLHAAITDVGTIKEAVVAYMNGAFEQSHLEHMLGLFNQIKGGMRILSMHEAARVLDAVGRYVSTRLLAQSVQPSQAMLDDLADAITCIEYYLEGAAQDRVNRQSVLERARESMVRLDCPVAAAVVDVSVSGAEADINDSDAAVDQFLDAAAPFAMTATETDMVETRQVEQDPQTEPTAAEAVAPVAANKKPAPGPAVAQDLDPEILEIFIEEATEELANITAQLPLWRANPDDDAALTTLRRSFHTLKGSGRLVGALLIGDFAWAYESLLNRVLDHTITPTNDTFLLLDHAIAALPELITQLTDGAVPTVDVPLLIEQSQAMSRGENPDVSSETPWVAAPLQKTATDEGVEEIIEIPAVVCADAEVAAQAVETADASVVDPSVPVAAAPVQTQDEPVEDSVMDPVLMEIFSKESAGHLEDIHAFIEACRSQREGCHPNERLVRALHTLHGSAHMAGSNGIADLAGDLEKYCKNLRTHQALMPAEGLEVLNDCATAVSALLAVLNIPEAPRADTSLLRQRVDVLYELPMIFAERNDEFCGENPSQSAVAESGMAAAEKQTMAEPAAVPRVTTAVAALDDVDLELLEVFIEEGEEVLAHSDELLQQWLADQSNTKLVEALQRELHTLKGGARLSGLTAMGNLSHVVESALAAVVDGRLKPSNRLFDVVHMVQDRLVNMLEQARAQMPMEHAIDLIQEVEELLGKQLSKAEMTADDVPHGAVSAADDDAAVDTYPLPREPDVVSLREDRRSLPRIAHEQVRVRADLLDNMVNYAGEVSIYRSRMEQQVSGFRFNLTELSQTVARLREQLRKMEIETEAQILFRYEEAGGNYADFDPLELDRFSHLQQLSRSLVESVGDVTSIQGLFDNLTRESETLLLQQSRVVTELQEGLMRTRMVPFASLAPRLRRIVRQTCQELDKRSELILLGAEGEMDRTVIDRVLAPLEHMLRNAVSHGIETRAQRRANKKHEVGKITIAMAREGGEVVLTVADDGGGIDLEAIRGKAKERGLLVEGDELSDNDVMQFILESGFSTAKEITQISGRGVGMDVVNSEIKQLGGSLHIDSKFGRGTTFTVRLPFTLAISHALLVQVAEENYAIPLSSIEGIVRLSTDELERLYNGQKGYYKYAGQSYLVRHLGALFDFGQPLLSGGKHKVPVLLVRSGDQRVALQVEGLLGSREIVVKSVGPQISSVRGVSGATILGDGRVVLILDMAALVRLASAQHVRALRKAPDEQIAPVKDRLTVMVVDDSITVRKVTTRLLERNNMIAITAKDGVDAVAMLQEHMPDIMLLDVEMPRMDGYELATHMRNEDRLRHIPIIMITSRTGEKHRDRAMSIGVNTYLGKPYLESDLLEHIALLTAETLAHA